MPAQSHNSQDDPQAQAIAERIKTLREAIGLTAVQLDRLTGQSSGTTGRLERGHQKIYASHLFRIAQATGVEVAWFYCEPDVATSCTCGAHDFEQQRLLDAYLSIQDTGLKRDVFELVESLANEYQDTAPNK
ncbi:MAG TPA: helix-turn-helix transcriptional regulator [Magnetovibrio sp.]